MKILKKLLKIFCILLICLILGLTILDIYLIKKPELEAKKKIDDIDQYATSINNLSINENVKIIGLGEATHGNKEFQVLKLDVLKALVEKYNVTSFAMEMDYGEGVYINDYINNKSNLSIDMLMNVINFDIYKTEDIKNLIEWMKQYNASNDNKLSFYGFDLQNPDVDLTIILEFLKDNSILEDLDFASICNPYLSGEITFKDEAIQPIFDNLTTIKEKLISSEEYQSLYNYNRILDCIENVFRTKELAIKYNDGMVIGGEYRDQMMAKKVIEIANTLTDSRLMIAGHNGHIGYAGSFTKTMGHFIQDELNEQYYAIGTDYFITNCNIKNSNSNTRKNHKFVSADILAYQAKDLGTYYLDFSKVDKNSSTYQYISKPIYTGSLGESYSILNTILQDSVRIYCEPNYLFDSMIFIYETTPLNLLG